MMGFLRICIVGFLGTPCWLLAQAPVITPAVVPAPGEIYTYKFIQQPLKIDTGLIGENVLWDFRKVKDTATYYEEVYRESTPSQNEIFEDSYSLDSCSIKSELTIWVNYLDSTRYYRLGAYEKPTVFESEIPYLYDDTLMLLKFPFGFGETMHDQYAFIKGGRRHYKNEYVEVSIQYDGYGTLILPNNDTCHQAMRIRREENFYHLVNETPKHVGTKTFFYWYSATKQNYLIKVSYANGNPIEAWFQKKKSFIKKKRNYN
jgi:hypothetical protein